MNKVSACLVGIYVLAMADGQAANLKLDSCFTDNMVLQRDVPARISGKADAGAVVTVAFAGQRKEATAGKDGAWRVTLDPMLANSTPQVMTVTSSISNLKSEISNVVVGDVWVCSGQSNMRMTVMKGPWCGYGGVLDATNEVLAAEHPGIRFFQNFGATNWEVCTPESVKRFSAAGYFFARDLHRHLKVPIGMAEGSMGGTDAESWAPREALFDAAEIAAAEKTFQELKPLADADRKAMGAWKRDYDAAKKEDKGREQVRVVCMDLSDTYRSIIQKYFPNAMIVADRFHVIRLINHQFLNLWRLLDPSGSRNRGLLSLMRRHYHNLKAEQAQRLTAYLQSIPALKIIYDFKQRLTTLLLLKHRTARQCRQLIPSWLEHLRELTYSAFPQLAQLGRTLSSWSEEIVRMWRFTKNNGITEGFHTKMEMISRRAFGFRNFDNYRLRVRVMCA